ncbi:MAG: flagellar hook-basal body complex protein, partial [Peptostreptococcaceae bacterium]
MKVNQTKMDVIANNTANVGTTAFKKSTVRFTDALYQNTIYSSGPGGTADNSLVAGGVSPGQVGIGAKVSGIFKNMVQGAIQPTGRSTDLAIDGDGFFAVSLGGGQVGYTRDGSFSLDMNGNLVTADGYKVVNKLFDEDGELVGEGDARYDIDTNGDGRNDSCAVQIPKDVYVVTDDTQLAPAKVGDSIIRFQIGVTDDGNSNPIYAYQTIGGQTIDADQLTVEAGTVPKQVVNFNIGRDGKISYLLEDGTLSPKTDSSGQAAEGYQQIVLSTFQNPEGLEQLAGNMYGVTANSGNAISSTSLGVINQGAIEMSNVDLSEEFTEMIVTQRAFQASSKVITTSDELLQEIMSLKR